MANSPPMPPPGGGMPPPPMSLPAQEVNFIAPAENGGFNVDMTEGAEPEAPGRPDEEQPVGESKPLELEASGENDEQTVEGFTVPKPKQEFAPPPVNDAFANLGADFFDMPKPKSSKGKSKGSKEKGKAPSPQKDTTPEPTTTSVPPPAPFADVSSTPKPPVPVSTGERLDAADTYASPSPDLSGLPPPAALSGSPAPNGSMPPPDALSGLPAPNGSIPPPAVAVTPPIVAVPYPIDGLPPPNASVIPPSPSDSSSNLVPPAREDSTPVTKPRSNTTSSAVRFADVTRADVIKYDEETGELRNSLLSGKTPNGQSAPEERMDQPLMEARDGGGENGFPEGYSAFNGFTPTPGFQTGRWEYTCVDPTGLRLRRTYKYAKSEKTGGQLHFGQKFLVCERGDEGHMRWLCLADGQGWAFERTNRRRASEITYEELDPALAGSKFMVCPTYGSPVSLALGPYLHSGNSALNTVMPGNLVNITQKATSIVQAKNGKGDWKRSFIKILYNSDVEGWMPEFGDDMQKMAMEYKFEPAGDSAWISIMCKDVKLWPSPGICGAKFATGKAVAGDIFPVEEICTAGDTTFYRLPDKNWVAGRTKSQKECDLVTREEHWWQYSCIDKDGTAIRHAPTRSTNMNTGKMLKHRQRICCSEIVKFPDGDIFLHVEPPLDGWVPLTKLGGAKKFAELHEMPPRTGKGKGKGKGKAFPPALPGPQPMMPMTAPAYPLYGQAPQGVAGDFGISGGRGSVVSVPVPVNAGTSITIQVDTASFAINPPPPQAVTTGARRSDFGI